MRAIIGFGTAAATLIAACAHGSGDGEARTTTTTLTSSTVYPARDAVRPEAVLAGEVCHREARCNVIGGSGRWHDEAACVRNVSEHVAAELDGWECAPAARRARFKDCAASIAEEPCTTIIDREMGTSLCPGTADCTD